MTSPGRAPATYIERAITSAQVSMSFAEYPTTVGRPVVPLEACTRTHFSRGTASMP